MHTSIIPISAFNDNYIWFYCNPTNKTCFVVDPGDAKPVFEALSRLDVTLSAILITHHHHDHTGGVKELVAATKATVYGFKQAKFDSIDIPLVEGDKIELKQTGQHFQVLEIPGHTLDHIAYYNNEALFCGDTLFSAGCGRLFEGTAEQMFQSLSKLANLPEKTLVYCAHEYTEANLRFALTVEPDNQDLKDYAYKIQTLRKQNKPSLPSNIYQERLINPFLRCHSKQLIENINKRIKKQLTEPWEVFAELRNWKDNF